MAKNRTSAKSRAMASSKRPARKRTPQDVALRESEEKWRSILENVRDFIFLLGPDLKIRYINRTLPGLEREDVIGKNALDYVPPERHDVARAALQRVLQEGRTETYETVGAGPRGEQAWYSTRLGPARLNGEIVAAVCVATDITEHHRAREVLQSRNRIADIFLTVPDERMYGDVLQVILDVMESQHGAFGFIDENGAIVFPSMTRDIWEQCQVPDKDIVFPRETWGGIWGRALTEKRSLYSNGPLNVPEGHIPVCRALSVPITHRKEVIGLLLVGNKATDYENKDRELLETIAVHIAPVLNARLERERQEAKRHQAEAALRESEERYRTLFEKDPDGVALVIDGKIAVCNPGLAELVGRSPGEVEGRSPTSLVVPGERKRAGERIRELMQGGPEYRSEYRLLAKGRSAVPVEVLARQIQYDNRPALLVIIRNISARKEAERALVESEEKWHSLVENAHDFIFLVDRDLKIQYINHTVPGLERDGVIGRSIFDYITPEYHDVARKAVRRVFRTGGFQTYENKGTGPNGEEAWYSARLGPVEFGGRVVAVAYVATDMTSRRLTEEALRDNEQRLRTLVTNAPVILFAVDCNGVFTAAEGKGMSLVGLRPEEHVGRSIFELYGNVAAVTDAARRALGGEAFTTIVELRMSTFEAHVTPIRDGDGEITGAIAVATDITARRRAEQEIQLLQSTTQAISQAQDFNAALEVALAKMCEATACDFGEAWVPRADGRGLECCPAWDARTKGLERFRQASELVTFSPGVGLPGRVWSSKVPQWVQDISTAKDEPFPRVQGAADVGLKAALAVPIMAEGQVLAVLEFLMQESREEDKRLVDLISAVAAQLGSIVIRKRAEDALRMARGELERRVQRRMRRKNPYRLSLREFTILHLVAVGRTDKEIGEQLEISHLTVHKHVANLLTKIGAKSRTEASVRAIREGLLD